MLFALGTGAARASAQSLGKSLRAGLADNDNACAGLLSPHGPVILTQADGHVVVDARRERRLNRAYLDRDLARFTDPSVDETPYDDQVNAIVSAYPRLGVGAAGGLVVLERGDESGRRSIRYHRRAADLHAWTTGANHLDHVHAASPDGRYLILSDFEFRHQQLVDATNGAILIERRTNDEPNAVAMKFSPDGRALTVRVDGLVEVFAVRPHLKFLAAHHVGPAEIDIDLRAETGDPSGRLTLDARGEIHYLPKTRALAAFFVRAEPVLLFPRAGAPLRLREFDAAPPTDFQPSLFPAAVGAWGRAFLGRDERPAYLPRGLVAPSEKTLFAVRAQYITPRTEAYVELFELKTGRYLRRFKIPTAVAALALSPSERFLAVASPDHGGIRVYDLHEPDDQPRVLVQMDNYDGRLLTFEGETHLLVGSDELSRLLMFDVSGRTGVPPPDPNAPDFLR